MLKYASKQEMPFDHSFIRSSREVLRTLFFHLSVLTITLDILKGRSPSTHLRNELSYSNTLQQEEVIVILCQLEWQIPSESELPKSGSVCGLNHDNLFIALYLLKSKLELARYLHWRLESLNVHAVPLTPNSPQKPYKKTQGSQAEKMGRGWQHSPSRFQMSCFQVPAQVPHPAVLLQFQQLL